MEIAVTRVERRDRRNSRITTTAITSPITPSSASDEMESVMKGAWSNIVVNSASPPTSGRSSVRVSANSCEVSTIFAFDVGYTTNATADFPSIRAESVASAPVSSTLATSPNGTEPLVSPVAGSVVMTGIARSASSESILWPTVTSRFLPSSATVPTGTANPLESMASCNACVVTPFAAAASALSSMVTRCSGAPTRVAEATPSIFSS